MTIKIKDLREKRNVLAKEARHIVDNVSDSDWKKDEHGKKFDTIMDSIDQIESQICAYNKALDLDAKKQFAELIATDGNVGEELKNRARIDQKWMRGGDQALTNDEWAVVRNTMSTTTPAEGGYTVRTDVASQVIEKLKAFGGMREVATSFTTAQGNPLGYPTSDGTAEVGELKAENQPATDLDPVFGTVPLNAYKFSSKVIAIPFELLQDSSVNIEGLVFDRLQQRLGRIQNQYFTNGTGTNEPGGVAVKASASGYSVNTTLGLTYQDLLDLYHSVDPAYRKNGKFMFSDATLKAIRGLVDGVGRPIYLPSYDRGIAGGAPAELLGEQIVINQDVSGLAADKVFALYGDFSTYMIRDVMNFELFRFTDSAYSKKGQVGFLAWMRAGGNLLDTSAVKSLVGTDIT